MRISALSSVTGIPIATIKYYLREGLLPPGRATAATQAEYDETHIARLRLVRALVEVGNLPLASVHGVLAALDEESLADAVRTAHQAISPVPRSTGRGRADAGPRRAVALLTSLGWTFNPASHSLRRLDQALAGLEAAGLSTDPEVLTRYAEAALTLARQEVAGIPGGPAGDGSEVGGGAEDAVRYVVLGTVLYEPVLLALRRLAQSAVYLEARSGQP